MRPTHFPNRRRYLTIAAGCCALIFGLHPTLLGADAREDMDWNRAQQLLHKSKAGERLSPEDQAYLDLAKSARQEGRQKGKGGKDAALWDDDPSPMWQVAADRIKRSGVTPPQVEAVWLKQARIAPARFGEFPQPNEEMNGHLVKILQIARQRYPNLRITYLSTRIYAGYALTGLNPEPYAYENGFAIRDLILRQIKGDPALNCDPAKGVMRAPLLLWGPNLWADGVTPRQSDGLVWKVDDFVEQDRTHPSVTSGRKKVAVLLLNFFKTDPTAKGWFVR